MKHLFIIILICISFSLNSVEYITKNSIYLQAEIKWDTLVDSNGENIVWNNSQLIYFINESDIIMISAIHQLDNDSLICCIENVSLKKGQFIIDDKNQYVSIYFNNESTLFSKNNISNEKIKLFIKLDTLKNDNIIFKKSIYNVNDTYKRLEYWYNYKTNDSLRNKIIKDLEKYKL